MTIHFDNTFARDLEGAFVPWSPAPAPRPNELFFNAELAAELDAGLPLWPQAQREAVFSGNAVPEGAQPIAQAYAGHQFGGFSPQLGDGRALLLGEVIDTRGHRRDVAFKGSGRTPFSRGGDGKAAVGPMLREVLIGEALQALGVPTTRALAVVATGDWVQREQTLPAAVLTRVADSHLRVGSFEFFAARGDRVRLQRLLSHAVARHVPHAADHADPALVLLESVAVRQAALVAQWMGVGFIHGVMNTDNMSISGQSIDFGPCAFMEAHDPATVYSSIDRQGRYAYGNQPAIAQWNLARLAEALLPLMGGNEDEQLQSATKVLARFVPMFEAAMAAVWCRKLGWGLAAGPGVPACDGALAAAWALAEDAPRPPGLAAAPRPDVAAAATRAAQSWQALLQAQHVDHTLGWRRLLDARLGQEATLLALFDSPQPVADWLGQWRQAAQDLGIEIDPEMLRLSNPFVIARNHRLEMALAAASDDGDLQPFHELLQALRRPWEEHAALQRYGEPAPPEVAAGHRTFCGT